MPVESVRRERWVSLISGSSRGCWSSVFVAKDLRDWTDRSSRAASNDFMYSRAVLLQIISRPSL